MTMFLTTSSIKMLLMSAPIKMFFFGISLKWNSKTESEEEEKINQAKKLLTALCEHADCQEIKIIKNGDKEITGLLVTKSIDKPINADRLIHMHANSDSHFVTRHGDKIRVTITRKINL